MEWITDILYLSTIKEDDLKQLKELMKGIYTPVYKHLWPDGGTRYLNSIYNPDNFKEELSNPNSRYYFVCFESETIGILKVLLNEPLKGYESKNAVKLQRIYLDPSVQGKGIGKILIQWVETTFCDKEGTAFWLEAMDTQKAALSFYKKMGFEVVYHFKFDSGFMIEEYRGMYTMVKNIINQKVSS